MTHYAIYRHHNSNDRCHNSGVRDDVSHPAPIEYYVETYDDGRAKRFDGSDEVEIWCRRNCAFPSPEGPWPFDQAPTGGLMPASRFFRFYERVGQH